MASKKQTQAARRNVSKAQDAARRKKTISHMSKETRTALGKQGAAVAQRKRTGSTSPKTRQELYEEAKRRNIQGRSKMFVTSWPAPSVTADSPEPSTADPRTRGPAARRPAAR